jgi:hypothetical protein
MTVSSPNNHQYEIYEGKNLCLTIDMGEELKYNNIVPNTKEI